MHHHSILCPASVQVIFDPRACTKFILEQNVTRILFTPSLLQLITDTLEPAELARRLRGLRMCWLVRSALLVEGMLVRTFVEE